MKNLFSPWARPVRALLAATGLLAAGPALAQITPAWQSAVAAVHNTANGTAVIRATAIDPVSGAIFVTGQFSGQATFGSTVLVSVGTNNDVFVARYNPTTSAWAWAQRGGGNANDNGTGIAADGQGGVYVTGSFTDSGTFAGQPALSGTIQEMFVAAYAAADGTGRWAKSGGGTGTDSGQGIAADGQGGVYVTGFFGASGTFAGQPALSGTNQEMFVAAYAAADGTGRWAKSGGGSNGDQGLGIAADGQGGVYVTGSFVGNGTFAGQPALSGLNQEVFVAAYAAADGTGRWAKRGGGTSNDLGNAIAADGQGGVYVTGFFSTSGTFADQPALTGTGFEVFVAAYAATNGSGRWAKSGGGAGSDFGQGIAADGQGGVYVTGSFTTSGTFAGQPALSGGGTEVFVAAYTAANGTGRWAQSGGGLNADTGYGVAVGANQVYVGIGTGAAGIATFGTTTAPASGAVLGVLNQATGAWQDAAVGVTATGSSLVRATAIDPVSGAVFVTGQFTGQVVFGSTELTSAGSNDVFVARYNPTTGAWAWAQRGGGGGNDVSQGIATDGQGGVYITGYFGSTGTFAGQPTLTGTSNEMFVAAYAAADGSGRWAKSGGGGGVDSGQGITTDGQGGLYVTGYFTTTGTFAGQPTALSGTGQEMFVAAYTAADGSGRWAKSGGGGGTDSGNGIAIDGQGGLYVTGYFTTSGTFAEQPTLNGSNAEVFVAAYTAADGTGRWATSGGGTGNDLGYGIATDGQGGVYVTGSFTGSGTFAGQPALSGTNQEMFVAAYAAADGNGRWAKSGGGSGQDSGNGIAADKLGGVYVTGFFNTGGTFAGQPALGGTGQELFVAAYAAADGTGRWAKRGGSSGTDQGLGIAVNDNILFVSGQVALPATFDALTLPGTATTAVGVLAGLDILPVPAINSLSTNTGLAGSSFSGTGFYLAGPLTAITFTPASGPATTAASGYTSTATTVSGVVVPAGLAPGIYTLTVSNANGTSNGVTFTVTSSSLVINTTQTVAAGTYQDITVQAGGRALLAGDLTVLGTMQVQAGGTVQTIGNGCAVISGPGSFVLEAGGQLSICSPDGISASGATGNVQVAGTRSFSPQASYFYDRPGTQVTGTGLPAEVAQLGKFDTGTLTLSQAVAVRQALYIFSAGDLATNGQALTLLSDASGTALLANGGTGQVVGNLTVQRYLDPSLNPGLGYRHLAAPVAGQTVADLAVGSTAPVVNPAYNTAAVPGLTTPFPTIYRYDQARLTTSPATSLSAFDKGWLSPAALSEAAPVATQGFTVQLPGASTLSFTGAATQTALSIPMQRAAGATAAEAGWNFVGNPYAAPLDFSTVDISQRTNVDAAVYVFESTSQYGGAYRSYVNGVGNPLVGSSQGFWMRVSQGQTTGSLAITNANRVSDPAQQAPVRRNAADTRPQLTLALAGPSLSDALTLYAQSGATAGFDGAYDAPKLPNTHGLNLAALAATGQPLAIDGRADFATTTAIPLTVGVPAPGAYTLTAATLANLPAGTRAELLDTQTRTRTVLTAGAHYAFSTATTTAPGRFWLHLTPAAAPLATAGAALAAQAVVFPNPAHGNFTLLLPAVAGATQATTTLLNALGQVVSTRVLALPAGGATAAYSMAGLAAGVYALRVQAGKETATLRVVVE